MSSTSKPYRSKMPSSLASQIGAMEALTAFRPSRMLTRGGGADDAAPPAGADDAAPDGAGACGAAAPEDGAGAWQAVRLTRTEPSTARDPIRMGCSLNCRSHRQ